MKRRGFTFMELVVVISVMIIVLPTLYAIFFIILQQQVKLTRLSEVRRQGNFVTDTIISNIGRTASSIHTATPTDDNRVCVVTIPAVQTSYSGTLYFKDKMGNYFYFDSTGSPEKIASQSSISNTSVDIVSSKVISSNFSSSCSISGYSSRLINVSFDLCYNISGSCGTDAEKVTLHFQTSVALPYY